jgi:hypothetical protein
MMDCIAHDQMLHLVTMGVQKGGYAGSSRRVVIDLNPYTRPHAMEVRTGKYAWLATRIKIYYDKSNAFA